MSEMIERVARAVTAKRHELAAKAMAGGAVGLSLDHEVGRAIARAAIEAMREPTSQMLAQTVLHATFCQPSPDELAMTGAVLERLPPTGHPEARQVIAEVARDYRAMIDAALKEPE